jgi:hypothetical protein
MEAIDNVQTFWGYLFNDACLDLYLMAITVNIPCADVYAILLHSDCYDWRPYFFPDLRCKFSTGLFVSVVRFSYYRQFQL